MPESNSDALRSLLDEAAPQLTRLIAAMGIAPARRDDVLQEVCLAAWRKRPAGDDADHLRRWLFRVAVNRCRLEHRRDTRWRAIWQNLTLRWSRSAGGRGTHDNPPDDDDRVLVRRALTELDPQPRALLVLRYFLEFDSKEIGRILDLPAATVRGQLRRAREQLAAALKQSGYRDDE